MAEIRRKFGADFREGQALLARETASQLHRTWPAPALNPAW